MVRPLDKDYQITGAGNYHKDLSDAIGPIAITYAPLVGGSVWKRGGMHPTAMYWHTRPYPTTPDVCSAGVKDFYKNIETVCL